MKKLFLIALIIGAVAHEMLAQTPQAVCYQAVAKDHLDNNIINSPISIRATVLNQTGGTPITEWEEVWIGNSGSLSTDQFGLFSVEIGKGTKTGGIQQFFRDIDWGNGEYWLQIEMDPLGNSDFNMMGSNRIISVPYALYSEGANNAAFAEKSAVADSADVADFAYAAGTAATVLNYDTTLISQIAVMEINNIGDADGDVTNELQRLEVIGDSLYLRNPDGSFSGSGLDISVIEEDGDVTNELQRLEVIGDSLYLRNPDGSFSGSGLDISVIEEDGDVTNELQTLEIVNDSLFLKNADGTLSGGGVDISLLEMDGDTTNELQNLEFDGEVISLSGGNSVRIFDSKKPFSGPGASYDLPQGILGDHIVVNSGNYQVPQGKNFWITAAGPTIKLKGYGPPPFVEHPTTPNMPVFPPQTSVSDCMCTGILVDTTFEITPIVLDFINGSSSYTVPQDKILFVKSGMKNDEIGWLVVNNEPMEFLRSNFTRGTRIITFPENTTVEPLPIDQFGTVDLILTGFLVNKNF